MKRYRYYFFFLFCIIIFAINLSLFIFANNQNSTLKSYDSVDLDKLTNAKDALGSLVASKLVVHEELKNPSVENRTFNMPEGFEISLYASGFNQIRYMDIDDKNNVFFIDRGSNKVYLVKDEDNDGVSDKTVLIDEGLESPNGIDLYEGDLYVAEFSRVVAYRNINENGEFKQKDIVIPDVPRGEGHSTRSVKIGPDKKIYVANGSSCNICEEADNRRASIMRYDLDGSNGKIFATGLRNTVGYEFKMNLDGSFELWGVDHGRDLIGDDLPPEEVNIIEEGKNYGWPYCYGDQIANPEFLSRAEYCKASTELPKYNMQAHSAPLGINFYPKTTDFPEVMKHDVFIAFHGSWNRSVPTGYKIVRINTLFDDSVPVDFITGFRDQSGTWARPVDIKFTSNGDMLISDDLGGRIFRVSYK
jgi:glucose/arabinose dehydrogenase